MNSPSQSITIGLLAEFIVLRTKTALIVGDVVIEVVVDVVVVGVVGVVISGAVVVSIQG